MSDECGTGWDARHVNGQLGPQRPRGASPRPWKDVLAAVAVVAAVIAASLVLAPATGAATPRLVGRVESGGIPLDGYEVTLYRTVPDGVPEAVGRDVTDSSGVFSIDNPDASDPTRVYYLLARSPAPNEAVLASVLGAQPVAPATINPVTTVVFVYATAQFLDDGAVVGPVPGGTQRRVHGGESRRPGHGCRRVRARHLAQRRRHVDAVHIQLPGQRVGRLRCQLGRPRLLREPRPRQPAG